MKSVLDLLKILLKITQKMAEETRANKRVCIKPQSLINKRLPFQKTDWLFVRIMMMMRKNTRKRWYRLFLSDFKHFMVLFIITVKN